MSPSTEPVTVLAATGLEAWAARRTIRGVRIIAAGIRLGRLRSGAFDGAVITCGLAGSVDPGVRPGTVVIPRRVLRPDGRWTDCDPALVDALVGAARRCGWLPECRPLGTASEFVRGAARGAWAARGCAAVDMETGMIDAPRLASVRVVLDTPCRELGPAWQRPASVLARPRAWGEAMWLLGAAPRYARRAATVVAAALPYIEQGVAHAAPRDRRPASLPAGGR
jgi:hypothetical protein